MENISVLPQLWGCAGLVDRSFWWYESQLREQEEQLLGFDCFVRTEMTNLPLRLFTLPEEAGGDEYNGCWTQYLDKSSHIAHIVSSLNLDLNLAPLH